MENSKIRFCYSKFPLARIRISSKFIHLGHAPSNNNAGPGIDIPIMLTTSQCDASFQQGCSGILTAVRSRKTIHAVEAVIVVFLYQKQQSTTLQTCRLGTLGISGVQFDIEWTQIMYYFFTDPFFRNLKFIHIRQFCRLPHKQSFRSKKSNRSVKEFCCIK